MRGARQAALVALAVFFLISRGAVADTGSGSEILGSPGTHMVAPGETLLDIARRHDLGFVELRAANPSVDVWVPAPGTVLSLPSAHILPEAARRGIVVNLAEQRLYYFPASGGPGITFPVGIGKDSWETPLGVTVVAGKRANPTWTPPASLRAENPTLPARVPPGPNNPLGAFALDLGWTGIVIHGTNKPAGVGRRVSHGCIRLYPEDIEQLFRMVPIGTPVAFIDQPIKLGWQDGVLYLEAHPSQAQADQIEAEGRFVPEPVADIAWRVVAATKDRSVAIDWAEVERVLAERRGLPVPIGR